IAMATAIQLARIARKSLDVMPKRLGNKATASPVRKTGHFSRPGRFRQAKLPLLLQSSHCFHIRYGRLCRAKAAPAGRAFAEAVRADPQISTCGTGLASRVLAAIVAKDMRSEDLFPFNLAVWSPPSVWLAQPSTSRAHS